jgi:recombination protein RecR
MKMIRMALSNTLAGSRATPYLFPMASPEIEALTQALARLPGLGPRSARRAVLHLLKKRDAALGPLREALTAVDERLENCTTCGNVDTTNPCAICADPRRDQRSLCVVEEVADLWALDRSRLFPGRFHVLGGRLSALEGIRPEDLSIDSLVRRIEAGGIDEVVLAMNATLEGQTTAHYIAEHDRALRWDDPRLAIDWPLIGASPPLLSARDAGAPGLDLAEVYP